MAEQRDKVRCRDCELVQWSDREHCRRCGAILPEPIVKVVERIVFQPANRNPAEIPTVAGLSGLWDSPNFPTIAEMERTMILAAYQRSNRRPLDAARLLGIGKTTMYRKLREIKRLAA